MKKTYYTVVAIVFASTLLAQNSMTLLNKKVIKSTYNWQFVCTNYAFDDQLNVQIGKDVRGGILKLEIKTSSSKLAIGDRVFILLANNDFIYCVDKGTRTFANNESIIYYNINDLEFNKLLLHNITDIRFKIIGKPSAFDSQIGFFTASNTPTVYDAFSKEKISIDTKTEIKKLY